MLSADQVIEIYRGQTSKMEGCFKFLKDSSFRLNEIHLKKVERIEAMMSVMALTLFINNLGQMLLRDQLQEKEKMIPNQLGKQTQAPTLKWAFQLMERVVKIRIEVGEKVHEQFQGIGLAQRTIINCFGESAQRIYRFP